MVSESIACESGSVPPCIFLSDISQDRSSELDLIHSLFALLPRCRQFIVVESLRFENLLGIVRLTLAPKPSAFTRKSIQKDMLSDGESSIKLSLTLSMRKLKK